MIWQETHLAPRPVPVILVLKKSSKCCKKYGRKDQPVLKLSSTTCMNDKVNKLMLKLGQQIYFSTTIDRKAGFLRLDRLKMIKHKVWATTIVAPKLVGSMTTKGQMKPTCRVSLTASQAGENSQSNVPKHTVVSSILTDLIIFRRNLRRRTALSGPTIESAKQPNSYNTFPVILVLKKSSKCCKKYGRKDQPVMKLSSTTCMNDKVNKLMLKLGQQIYFSTTSSLLLQFCKVPISKSNKTQEQIIQTGTPSLPVAMMLLECLKSAGVAETRDRLRLSLNTSALRMQ